MRTIIKLIFKMVLGVIKNLIWIALACIVSLLILWVLIVANSNIL